MPTPAGGVTLRPVGLDFGAVMVTTTAAGADAALIATLLPDIEAAILAGLDGDGPDDGKDDDG